jgi:hypothetical protein
MSLLHQNGFDHMATADLGQLYITFGTQVAIASGARTGTGRVFRTSSSVATSMGAIGRAVVTPATTVTTGFAFFPNSFDSTTSSIVDFLDIDGVVHMSLNITSTGDVLVKRGDNTGTTMTGGTAAGVFIQDNWYWVEFQSTIGDGTAGSWAVKVNGAALISGSSTDTRNAGTLGQVAYVRIGHIRSGSSTTGNWDFDDWYIRNDSTYMGDVKIALRSVSGAGNSAQFTPLSSTNASNVDDSTNDGDTTYNYSNTASQKDTFALTSLGLSGTPSVKAVSVLCSVRKDDAGTRVHRNVLRSGSTDYEGSDFGPLTTYTQAETIWETDPNTAATWTYSNANAVEAGYKVQS